MAAAESTVWTWGRAKNYRLGRAFVGTDARIPEKVNGFEGVAVRQAACGGGHTAVVLEDDRLFVFGYSQYGQLGLGDRNDMCDATQVYLIAPSGLDPIHSSSIKKQKRVAHTNNNNSNNSNNNKNNNNSNNNIASASNSNNNNNNNTNNNSNSNNNSSISSSDWLSTLPVAQVACGRYHTISRTTTGLVFTWGGGKNGRLGHGDEKIRSQPTWVEKLKDEIAIHITAGYHNNLVLTNKNEVWSWGWGAHGQLGLGDTKDRDEPTVIEELSSERIKLLSCGDRHSFAVTEDGKVYGWGSNEFGQLGCDKKGDTILKPKLIQGLQGLKIIAVSSGDRHSACITNTGCIYTWGCGTDGQCGHNNNFKDIIRPKLILNPTLKNKFIIDVKCGHNFTMILTNNDEVFTWGNNTYGQLGNNSNGKFDTPVKVIIKSNAVIDKVSCGHFHCIMWMKVDENKNKSMNDQVQSSNNITGIGRKTELECIADTENITEVQQQLKQLNQGIAKDEEEETSGKINDETDESKKFNLERRGRKMDAMEEARSVMSRMLGLYTMKRDECRNAIDQERVRHVAEFEQSISS